MKKILNDDQLSGDAFSVQGISYGILFRKGSSAGAVKLQIRNPENSNQWIETGKKASATGLIETDLAPFIIYRLSGLTTAGGEAWLFSFHYSPIPPIDVS